jgi:F-type H+-transporting ATPase subunit b
MELDWTTFSLEILNFLVLVWLLKRFLYQPVLAAIAQRKAGIEQTLADAQHIRAEAEALRTQYDSRLAAWELERQTARGHLLDEISADRGRLMAEVQASLQKEREKAAAVEQRRLSDLTRRAEEQALAQSTRFAARLLSRLAGPDLEARIVDMVLADLPRLGDDERQVLRSACAAPDMPVRVSSAYPLQEGQRQALARTLQQLADRVVTCDFAEDGALVAGLRLSVGGWMLRANVQDELKFFTDSAHNAHGNNA